MILACLVALLASALTLFTGFGLGTLLLPAFALSMNIVDAVAATALVHLLNNLFKFVLVGRHARVRIVVLFGLPAMAAAALGAWTLAWLGEGRRLAGPSLAGLTLDPTPADLVVGLAIVVLALRALRADRRPADRDARADEAATDRPARHSVRMGLISGFLGGISGHQGAVRSAYLLHMGLARDAFIGTNVAIACLVDLARLPVYAAVGRALGVDQVGVWGPVTLCAFVGALLGARLMTKVRLAAVRRLVAITMILLGLAVAAGLVG